MGKPAGFVQPDPPPSPAGASILYVSNRARYEGVFTIGVDGFNPVDLTSSPDGGFKPDQRAD